MFEGNYIFISLLKHVLFSSVEDIEFLDNGLGALMSRNFFNFTFKIGSCHVLRLLNKFILYSSKAFVTC